MMFWEALRGRPTLIGLCFRIWGFRQSGYPFGVYKGYQNFGKCPKSLHAWAFTDGEEEGAASFPRSWCAVTVHSILKGSAGVARLAAVEISPVLPSMVKLYLIGLNTPWV